MMLDTARQLAAGMGAPAVKHEVGQEQSRSEESPSLGNAPLGLWVGERFQGMLILRVLTGYAGLNRTFAFHRTLSSTGRWE